MNYLAHFHLAGENPHHIVGGLLGDFIKGPLANISELDKSDPRKHLSNDTLDGIRLHRRVDAYVDNHLAFAELSQLIPEPSRRFRGIVTDLYCDYALSHHWHRFESTPLPDFIEHVLTTLKTSALHSCSSPLPEGAQSLLHRFQHYKLLERYAERSVIDNIIQRIGMKLRCSQAIAEAQSTLWENEALWEAAFLQAYPDILAEAKSTLVRFSNQ